jgi:hypothetical protein
MSRSRIVMRLARNPGTEYAEGDDHRGYTLVAPLTADGLIDETEYKREKNGCTVRRFAPEEDAQEGKLSRHGEQWFFDYGETDDEPVYKLGQHRFATGEYVAIADEDGRLLTYKVTDVQAV